MGRKSLPPGLKSCPAPPPTFSHGEVAWRALPPGEPKPSLAIEPEMTEEDGGRKSLALAMELPPTPPIAVLGGGGDITA